MKLTALCLATTMLVAPAAAFAQSTSGSGSSGSGTSGETSSSMTGQSGTQSGEQTAAGGCSELRAAQNRQDASQDRIADREQVASQLQQAGLSEVEVMRTAFLVEATSPENECVRLIVDASGAGENGDGAMSGGGSASNATGSSASGGGTSTGSAASGGTSTGASASGSGSTASDSGTSSANASGSGTSGAGTSGSGDTSSMASGSSGQGDQMEGARAAVGDILDEAGYSDVRFLEAAYAVRGTMSNGETVMLMVNADREGRVSGQPAGQGQGSGSGSMQNQGSQGGSSGTTGSSSMDQGSTSGSSTQN